MRDYVDDYLKEPEKPMSNNYKMALKLLIFGFVSAAMTDLLKTHTQVQGRIAELAGLLSGILVQQIIPPRMTVSKLAIVSLGLCIMMGILFLLLHR